MKDEREAGVTRTNQDFSRYDQVRKPQSYRLSESAEADEAFDDETIIRTCDMGDWFHGGEAGKTRFSQALGSAMEEIGFAILVNHGIDGALFERTEATLHEFFETIPENERQPYLARRHGSVNQGYFPIRETSIIHPDLVEGWVFCRRAFNLDDRPDFDARAFWPRPDYEAAFRELVAAEQPLILPVMQSILAYLGCDPHLYDDSRTPISASASTTTRRRPILPSGRAVGACSATKTSTCSPSCPHRASRACRCSTAAT